MWTYPGKRRSSLPNCPRSTILSLHRRWTLGARDDIASSRSGCCRRGVRFHRALLSDSQCRDNSPRRKKDRFGRAKRCIGKLMACRPPGTKTTQRNSAPRCARALGQPLLAVAAKCQPPGVGWTICPAAIGSDRIHSPAVVNSTISRSIGSWLTMARRGLGKFLSASTCAR